MSTKAKYPGARTITEDHPVILTDAEIQQRGEELAKHEGELETLVEEKLAAGAGFRGKIKETRAIVARLANDINRKAEDRPTKVEIRFQIERGAKVYVRLDTEETIREEAMTPGEIEQASQAAMFPATSEEAEAAEAVEEKARRKREESAH